MVGGLSVASSLIALAFTSSNLRLSVIILFVACMGYGGLQFESLGHQPDTRRPRDGGALDECSKWYWKSLRDCRTLDCRRYSASQRLVASGVCGGWSGGDGPRHFIWAFMVPRVEQVQWKIQAFNTATN